MLITLSDKGLTFHHLTTHSIPTNIPFYQITTFKSSPHKIVCASQSNLYIINDGKLIADHAIGEIKDIILNEKNDSVAVLTFNKEFFLVDNGSVLAKASCVEKMCCDGDYFAIIRSVPVKKSAGLGVSVQNNMNMRNSVKKVAQDILSGNSGCSKVPILFFYKVPNTILLKTRNVRQIFQKNDILVVRSGLSVQIYKSEFLIKTIVFPKLLSIDVKIGGCCKVLFLIPTVEYVGGSYYGKHEVYYVDMRECDVNGDNEGKNIYNNGIKDTNEQENKEDNEQDTRFTQTSQECIKNHTADSCSDVKIKKLPLYPVHDIQFLKTGFAICHGHQPSDVFIYNFDCELVFKFPKSDRNRIFFNPHETLVCFGGFENLPGIVEVYDLTELFGVGRVNIKRIKDEMGKNKQDGNNIEDNKLSKLGDNKLSKLGDNKIGKLGDNKIGKMRDNKLVETVNLQDYVFKPKSPSKQAKVRLLFKDKIIGASRCIWSPSGTFFAIGVLSSMKIDNKIIIFDYFGRMIDKLEFKKLFNFDWTGESKDFREIEEPDELNIRKEAVYIPKIGKFNKK
ncbi:Eukaryotic translation initiation factor 2A [Dictyocoela roeselum]|nr:Eukaryotic translation initiation factor 2A [Dictyocoela roeselum]